MPLHVRSRRKKTETLFKEFPRATLLDLTSKADPPWIKFSSFYPHENIPVPTWRGKTSASVEGIWQALKVFESADIHAGSLENRTMKNVKRTIRRFGSVLGHLHVDEDRLLPYVEARRLI